MLSCDCKLEIVCVHTHASVLRYWRSAYQVSTSESRVRLAQFASQLSVLILCKRTVSRLPLNSGRTCSLPDRRARITRRCSCCRSCNCCCLAALCIKRAQWRKPGEEERTCALHRRGRLAAPGKLPATVTTHVHSNRELAAYLIVRRGRRKLQLPRRRFAVALVGRRFLVEA